MYLPHLEWADVLILTSATEGLPGAVLRRPSPGCRPSGFDVGGVSEAVIDGSTGRLVRKGDIDALSGILVELAADRVGTRSMGEEARRLASSRFTLDDAVDRFASVFNRLLRPGWCDMRVAHLTTVDMSLRFLVLPQLRSVVDWRRGIRDLGARPFRRGDRRGRCPLCPS